MAEENIDKEVSKETPEEEVSEEAPQEDAEEVEEENSEASEKEKQPEQEYTKERFDGVMSSWQKDRMARLELEKRIAEMENANKPAEQNQDDLLIDHLRQKIKEKDAIEEERTQKAVREELERLKIEFPDLTEKEIMKTAIDYSEGNDNTPAISLRAAAKITKALKQQASDALKKQEEAKKNSVGKLAGRAGYQTVPGVRPYNPEKDKGKSIADLIDDAKREAEI